MCATCVGYILHDYDKFCNVTKFVKCLKKVILQLCLMLYLWWAYFGPSLPLFYIWSFKFTFISKCIFLMLNNSVNCLKQWWFLWKKRKTRSELYRFIFIFLSVFNKPRTSKLPGLVLLFLDTVFHVSLTLNQHMDVFFKKGQGNTLSNPFFCFILVSDKWSCSAEVRLLYS